MNRLVAHFAYFVLVCIGATLVKNKDYYSAIESRYNEMITKNSRLSKYKTTIYGHLEQIVGDNAYKIMSLGEDFMCNRCGHFDTCLQKLMLHECY
jgi:hypothetical protein